MEAARDIPRRLPRGTHGLDPGVVAASQRTRLLEAVGGAVADKGYPGATIDDIVRGAGVSKKTFYDHFRDKLDCFLAAYEAASDELLARLRDAQSGHEGWLERTRAGIVAYLPWLAAEPALALVAAVDEVVVGRIRESGGADLPELEPVLLHLQVALLAGPEVAARQRLQ